ncbi:glycoside hydrolase superfamily [Ephemerocybe angulata]|uniref:Beta-xylanase n=1 Tax=Ephemerocybe angulata TaxID=980116 RepID=A0A8H6HM69_9AGAR|nr:glycoside hydrolase superfamily [Tulosesus angulatus]
MFSSALALTLVIPFLFTTAHASLNSMMQANGKLYFGNIIDANTIQSGADQVLKSEFGMFTPEYSWKWSRIQPKQGEFNFDDSDTVINWAMKNRKKLRGHTLVWHQNIPDWVDSITDKANLTTVIKDHITKVVGRYKGRVYAWDVVNEAFNEDGTFRNSVFHRVLGQDFIDLAFKTAREVDPNAKLYINEYNLDYAGPKIDAMLSLIRRLQIRGVPIDAIGSQTHLTSGHVRELPEQLRRLGSTGLDVAITDGLARSAVLPPSSYP